MLSQQADQKRHHYRVYLEKPITCKVIDLKDKAATHKKVMIHDMSSRGLYFEIDELFDLNAEFDVSFRLPGSNQDINATVKVVRVEVTEEKDFYGIGSMFIRLNEKDKHEIEQLVDRFNLNRLLEFTIKKGGSDLHLVTNSPPVVRVHGELETLALPKLSSEDLKQTLYSVMSKNQIHKFEEEKELDFGIQYENNCRFRVNLHQQRGFLEATLRLINVKEFSLHDLNIPDVVRDLARHKSGLILVSGPTGSGKTTTIAAMVDLINKERKGVIIALERPIEYTYKNEKCIIKQREVGIDTLSFSAALKSSLKQDPNVIIVGELDDAETTKTALIAAETGYLVIASFHAPSIIQTIDRLATEFPADHRKQVLSLISNCLKGIICQLLIPRKDRKGRVLASEVFITNDAAKKIIRNDTLVQLNTIIQTGASLKMQPMRISIKKLVSQGMVDDNAESVYSEILY